MQPQTCTVQIGSLHTSLAMTIKLDVREAIKIAYEADILLYFT